MVFPSIRQLRTHHAEEVYRLEIQSFPEPFRINIPDIENIIRAYELSAGAWIGKQLIGYILTEHGLPLKREFIDVHYVTQLCVQEEQRRKGYASGLLVRLLLTSDKKSVYAHCRESSLPVFKSPKVLTYCNYRFASDTIDRHYFRRRGLDEDAHFVRLDSISP